MNIEYLQLMDSTKRIFGEENEPVKENDITCLEQKLTKTFPKAYREFLFLGGDGANMMGGLNFGFYQGDTYAGDVMVEMQNYVKAFLKEEKLVIEGGEFWVIGDLDGGESFHFFYFNDPDAVDPENPPVYASYPAYLEDGYPLKEKIADSFSQYIEDKIRAYQ